MAGLCWAGHFQEMTTEDGINIRPSGHSHRVSWLGFLRLSVRQLDKLTGNKSEPDNKAVMRRGTLGPWVRTTGHLWSTKQYDPTRLISQADKLGCIFFLSWLMELNCIYQTWLWLWVKPLPLPLNVRLRPNLGIGWYQSRRREGIGFFIDILKVGLIGSALLGEVARERGVIKDNSRGFWAK